MAPRRTQAERSAQTRGRVLDAALDVLLERGWSGTSTAEVGRRGGVSRGALLHHFPTKDDLVRSAVQYVMDRRVEEFTVAIGSLDPATPTVERLEAAIDVLWGIYRSPTMAMWHDLIVAGRTDVALGAVTSEVQARLDAVIDEAWRDLFPQVDVFPDGFYEVAPRYLFTILNGLAFRTHVGDDQADGEAEVIVLATKLILRTMAEAPEETLLAHLAALAPDPEESP